MWRRILHNRISAEIRNYYSHLYISILLLHSATTCSSAMEICSYILYRYM